MCVCGSETLLEASIRERDNDKYENQSLAHRQPRHVAEECCHLPAARRTKRSCFLFGIRKEPFILEYFPSPRTHAHADRQTDTLSPEVLMKYSHLIHATSSHNRHTTTRNIKTCIQNTHTIKNNNYKTTTTTKPTILPLVNIIFVQ